MPDSEISLIDSLEVFVTPADDIETGGFIIEDADESADQFWIEVVRDGAVNITSRAQLSTDDITAMRREMTDVVEPALRTI